MCYLVDLNRVIANTSEQVVMIMHLLMKVYLINEIIHLKYENKLQLPLKYAEVGVPCLYGKSLRF